MSLDHFFSFFFKNIYFFTFCFSFASIWYWCFCWCFDKGVWRLQVWNLNYLRHLLAIWVTCIVKAKPQIASYLQAGSHLAATRLFHIYVTPTCLQTILWHRLSKWLEWCLNVKILIFPGFILWALIRLQVGQSSWLWRRFTPSSIGSCNWLIWTGITLFFHDCFLNLWNLLIYSSNLNEEFSFLLSWGSLTHSLLKTFLNVFSDLVHN